MTRRARRMLLAGAALATLVTTACDSGSWVAKAGPYTLDAGQYAELLAGWEYFPMNEVEVEKWAHRWVEWTLFADRIASGDSLSDSALVYHAVWPEVHELLFQALQAQILADSLQFSDAQVETVFTAGDYRLIYHILLRVRAGAGEEEERTIRGRAEAIRARLVAGGAWDAENQQNMDPAAKDRAGSVGVIRRGDMTPVFDSVAYELEPGEFSQVVDTEFGYHVVWRPALEDRREEFTGGYVDARFVEIDRAFQEDLPKRYDLTYVEDAPEIVRRATRRPLAMIDSQERIASIRGGEFTVEDLIRRLRMEPPDMRFEMIGATDERIIQLLDGLLGRELLVRAALDGGASLTPALDAELKFGHKQNMADIIENMELDRFFSDDLSASERQSAVSSAVWEQFEHVAARDRVPRYVQTYVSDILRQEASWRVSDKGVAAALEQAQRLKESQP